jgi:hypothetical protein
MSNDELQKNKFILQGRIYPAIQACVNNRYKIILGVFAYYSFIFTSEKFRSQVDIAGVNLLVSIIFSVFVGHNLVNYWMNAWEQCKIENDGRLTWKDWPIMEILFSAFTLVLIWGAHTLFICS